MAEEQKTEGQQITDPKSDETKVTISQEKLDSLINEKFKKGAEKAKSQLLNDLGVDSEDALKEILEAKREADEAQKTELEKERERAEALTKEKEDAIKLAEQLKKENSLNKLAAQHGIKEVDYFNLELQKHSGDEDFNAEEFVNGLRESKPFIFGETKAPKTDTSGNNNQDPQDLQSVVSNLSFKELQKLQQSL